MIRIVLTCVVTASLVFAGCDEPAKTPADSGGGAGAGAAPSTTAGPTVPKKGAKAAESTVKTGTTKPVD
jgi:hypothetical protein